MQLTEQYRPQTWDDLVGQDKIVQRIKGLAKRGLAGRAYWLTGQRGTGKTTIARLIAGEIADPAFIEDLDAATLTVSDLVEIERGMNARGWGKKNGKAFIIDGAHALTKAVIRQLLVVLERLPAHVAVVFTTTNEGQTSLVADCDDTCALLSRCIRLDLSRRGLCEPFAQRAREIATKEALNGSRTTATTSAPLSRQLSPAPCSTTADRKNPDVKVDGCPLKGSGIAVFAIFPAL